MPEHTIAENLTRLQNATTAIGNAITAKGGTVGANDGLEEFAADIATIPSGGVEFSNTTPFTLLQNIRNLDVIIPSGVTSIGDSAFKGCQGLNSIEIPSSVTSIGSGAFQGCTGLTSITIPSSINFINQLAFTSCTNLETISLPNAITAINNQTFQNCTSLKSIDLPNSLTSIGDSAFYGCTGLTSIEIPNSVTVIASSVFQNCTSLEKIYIDNEEGSIIGSPWGAPSTTQVIWRKNRYQSSCTEVASGTTLTGTVNATVGDLVVATFAIRGNTYTFDSGWTLLGIGDNGALNQRTAMAYKIATSSNESLTVTQDTAGRMYINLVSITGASVGTFSGFTTQATGSSITLPKPQGLVIWGVSATYWGSRTPYQLWSLSDKSDVTAIQLPNTTQPRCLIALDQSNNASETFTIGWDGDGSIAAASLTITGIDNFWYYDD